ncbi:MAG: hypothetical protein ACOC9X_05735 [bacterium]
MPRNPHKRQCSALTKGGRRCSSWARRASQPPLCHVHSRSALPEDGKRRCTARTAAGKRCAQWAMAGETTCAVHAGRLKPQETDRRCVARRRDGGRCKNWGMRNGEQPFGRVLCAAHAGALRPTRERDRCQARTNDGRRCRSWAMPHTRDPHGDADTPLCAAHQGRCRQPDQADADAGRQCTATTANGERCRKWATLDSQEQWGQPLCRAHAPAEPRLPQLGERRCTATTANGERCPHWALRSHQGRENPLCPVHAPEVHYPLPDSERRCTARNRHGQRCQHWATDQEKQLCWLHADPQNHPRLRHGFYRIRRHLDPRALALLESLEAAGRPLDARIAEMRVRLYGLLAYSSQNPLTPDELCLLAELTLRGVRAVARAAHARREATG